MPYQILNVTEVEQRTLLSRSTISRLEALGQFPRRRKLSCRRIGWLTEDVEAWIELRLRKGAQEAKPYSMKSGVPQ